MTIEEQYQPVTHKHNKCPICEDVELIQDIPLPKNNFDKLMIAGRNADAKLRILWGKKIEVKEG